MPRIQAARNGVPRIPSGCIGGCRTSELNSRYRFTRHKHYSPTTGFLINELISRLLPYNALIPETIILLHYDYIFKEGSESL
jgi:hypothetical protein